MRRTIFLILIVSQFTPLNPAFSTDEKISSEVRWFFPGAVPHNGREWFEKEVGSKDPQNKKDNRVREPEKRIDTYLALRVTPNVVIKLRNDNDDK